MANPIEGQVADGIVAWIDDNKATILADLAKENQPIANAVEGFVAPLLQKVPVIGGLLGGYAPQIATYLVTYLGGEEPALFAALDAWLHSEAKALGG